MSVVSNFYNIDLSDLLGSKRSAKYTTPRHICMYILKNTYNLPYKKIGYLMGGRDHTTIISAVEKISLQMKQDSEVFFILFHLSTHTYYYYYIILNLKKNKGANFLYDFFNRS